MLTASQVYTHKSQIVNEAVQWAEGVKGIKDPDKIDAYRAGLEQGAASMLANLKLHGVTTSNKAGTVSTTVITIRDTFER